MEKVGDIVTNTYESAAEGLKNVKENVFGKP